MLRITRAIEFSASLCYRRADLSEEENHRRFGVRASRHGHNYRLEVTLRGEPDPASGMVLDLKDLNDLLEREVMSRFDHRDLNDDIIRYYDAATGTIVDTDVIGMFPSVYLYSIGGTTSQFILVFTAEESQPRKNLNRANGREDHVLGYYNVLTGEAFYTDLEALEAHVYGNFIAYEIREDVLPRDYDRKPQEYDRDLNDDGDLDDSIIRLVEIAS